MFMPFADTLSQLDGIGLHPSELVSRLVGEVLMTFGPGAIARYGSAVVRVASSAMSMVERVSARSSVFKFSQVTVSPFFSAEGDFAGKSIASLATELRSGRNPSTVPVEYLVRDGNNLIINTRSALALKQANVPISSWNLIDQTGVSSIEASMTERLMRNGLGNGGTDVLRITGADKKASLLNP